MVSSFFIGTSLEIVIGGGQSAVSGSARIVFHAATWDYILLRYHANPLTCHMRLSSDAFALGERPAREDYLT